MTMDVMDQRRWPVDGINDTGCDKESFIIRKKLENVRIFWVKFILSHTYKYKIYLKYSKIKCNIKKG